MTIAIGAAGQSGSGARPPSAATVDSKAPDRGQLDGVKYSNNFFGVSLEVPATWVVVSAQRTREITEDSTKKVVGDQQKKEELDASIQRSVVLLSLTKVPAGEPNNASFMLIAERIPSPTLKTGVDVIHAMENAFKGTNFSLELQGEVQTEKIAGADFGVVTIKNTSPNGTFMQKIYAMTKNGYALELFYTYLNEEDLATLNTIVSSMKMK